MPPPSRDRENRKQPKKVNREKVKEEESKGYKKQVVSIASVFVLCIALAFKALSNYDTQTTFAGAELLAEPRVLTVTCSDDYKKDTFTECKPKSCGRIVRDDIVTEAEATHLLGVAKKGLQYGGSNGGASILDLHTGALSKKDKFVNVYSVLSKEDAFTELDFTIYKRVKNKIHHAISEHFNIPPASLYLTKPTFFSRMNTSEAKTIHDEYWHKHIDRETYGSFHYTSLLYLATYKTDFTGGRFIFTDDDVETAVEPRFGRVSFFTSGSENVHFVEKLESGVRYAITISFTCDPDMAISDPDVR